MEEIIKKLEDIVNKELDKGGVPSSEVLEVVRVLSCHSLGVNISHFSTSIQDKKEEE